MSKKGKDADLRPEELMRRKFKAKCNFRALGRMVMANAYWLIEDIDQYDGLDDVKRRVQQAVRGKKKSRLLTIQDKVLLTKSALDRTEAEKKYLYRIIGGLKCFKRYPNHVKRKLAALTYFRYYGPNRVVVRETHVAKALYFVVTGDIVISQNMWDELLQVTVSVDIGYLHSGDIFGELPLLHSIPWSVTITTIGHCEFLALMAEDFKNVLSTSIQKQWDNVLEAMSNFTYFDALDEVARREGCIVARMKSYKISDYVLGDGAGIPNNVYFVLSGVCQMIESFDVHVSTHLGRTFYNLYDPYVPESVEDVEDLEAKYYVLANVDKKSRASAIAHISSLDFQTETDKNNKSMKKKKFSMSIKSLESEDHLVKYNASKSQQSVPNLKDVSKHDSHFILDSTVGEQHRPSFSLPANFDASKKCKKYYMQVCQFRPGSSFGFGENMRDRRIIALTPLHCMLMPKIWLLQRNTANIWTRIQHFLDKTIPNKRQLFTEFLSQRRWQEYRDDLVEETLRRSKTVNYTCLHDVPLSIRTEEMCDI